LENAAGAVLQALEERIVFGNGHPLPSTPLPIRCDTDANGVVQADPNSGAGSCPDCDGGSGGTGGVSAPTGTNGGGSRTLGDVAQPLNASSQPVRYFDGKPEFASTDLISYGFGKPWGQVRTWTGLDESGQVGHGWAVTGLPYLTLPRNQDFDGMISVVNGGDSQETFAANSSATAFTVLGASGNQLDYVAAYTDGSGHNIPGEFHLTDSSGGVTTFYDPPRDDVGSGTAPGHLYAGGGYPQQVTHQFFGSMTATDDAYRLGAFKSYTDADGNVTTATYGTVVDSSSVAHEGMLTAVIRTAPSGYQEQLAYTYDLTTNSLGGSVFFVKSATLQRRANSSASWVSVRAAEYTYYTGEGSDSDYGRLGDLKKVVIRDYQRDAVNGEVVDNKYYRYNKFWTPEYTGLSGYDLKGPGNDPATTGGTDTTYAQQAGDTTVFSGLRTIVEGGVRPPQRRRLQFRQCGRLVGRPLRAAHLHVRAIPRLGYSVSVL
jgi:hypothetical protein